VNPLRSVGAKLGFALFLIVTAVLGTVYLIVVPSLERRLVDARLDQLERSAPLVAQLPDDRLLWGEFVDVASATVNARVVIFQRLDQASLQVFEDSAPRSDDGIARDGVALRAAFTGGTVRGTVHRGEDRFAEVAISITPDGPYVLLTAPLDDSLSTVGLVAQRLLLGGLLALAAALLVGYLAARAFAQRIRRLERAAERIAGGRFDEPVTDAGKDELAELAHAFEQMRRRLAHLDRARGEFIANASHELRTPLFSLGGFLELLADEELDEETRREFLHEMQEQVARLGRLATDLLDLSRMDAGRLHVERSEIDLDGLAIELADEFRAVALAGRHTLVADANGSTLALGDEQRVFQIGRVLVENALVHTPHGTTVRISAGRAGEQAMLSVEDDGPGVAPDQAAHIFDRFYRAEGTQTSGSGLGLAIARELAELMGGTVEVESVPTWTRFTVRLPAA